MVRLLWFAFLSVVLTLCRGNDRPNFVFFVADDLGIGDVGCFGNDTIRTPNIDSIAAKGAKLTQDLAAAPVCTPSRAAFLTGRYPIRYGMVGMDGPVTLVRLATPTGLPRSEVTFPQLAKDHGYRTALIGKWHLGLNCVWAGDHCQHPNKFGFDYYYGPLYGNGPGCHPDAESFFGPRIAQIIYSRLHLWEISTSILVAILALKYLNTFSGKRCFCCLYLVGHLVRRLNCVMMRDGDIIEMPFDISTMTPRMTLEAVKFLEESKTKNEPFLLEVSFSNVHIALLPYKEFRGKSRHGLYGDSVEEMDWSVGVVMATLERLGLTDNTFVYFTSDNGGHIESGEDGGSNGIYKGGKGQAASEGGIRMPTIVQWPRKIKPGTIVSEATSQMDIFPTVADIIGAPLPQDRVIDGRNILSLLGGAEVTSPHDFLFHYCDEYVHAVRYRPKEGNVTWKAQFVSYNWEPGTTGCYTTFICRCAGPEVTYNDPPLLYDVTNDPAEDRPISAVSDPRYTVVIDVIKKAMEEQQKSLTKVKKQFGLSNFIPVPWLQECCNFPFCDCQENVDLSSLEIGG
ncbi:steryl-sulfatase-like [Branchiostoma floridae x Branchiostoma japonicum]